MIPRIVAVGASLGGLDATQLLLAALPASFPCPLVIVQHRLPEVDGRLVELLNARSAMPVVEPDDKETIEPGHVYVAPPNYHLIVEAGFFSLSVDAPVLFARPSIDVLFESMADSYGAHGVAVMLTGSNDDGAVGARAVKGAGGRVVVQNPETAKAPAAPRAVLAAITPDAVLPLEWIAGHLKMMCGLG
ncbi:MAG TPA: chemotaxis protein CheB [Polyangia bacterium]|jgi:two-component system chemotaxis response regulator CheB